MIRILLGNVGSGKTACCVREMMLCRTPHITYSNIITSKIKNNRQINSSMIIDKQEIGVKKNGEKIYKYEFNKAFWQNEIIKNKSINVTIDEAHTVLNARRGMSKPSQCMLDFIALIRRVIGQDPLGEGTLTLISQLERRIDVIASEMANQVRYHLCHYKKTCGNCGLTFSENNEVDEIMLLCPRCGKYALRKHHYVIEVWQFRSMDLFIGWKEGLFTTKRACNRHFKIYDIEKYFPLYNTLQWDNLLSDV